MALVNNPFLKGASGRIGNLVFFSRNGKTFVKLFQKNRKSDSPAVKTHQEKFKMMMQFLHPLRPFIRGLHVGTAPARAHFNQIFSENLGAIAGIYPDLSISYSKLMISKGVLANGTDVTASSPARGKLEVKWKNKRRQTLAKAEDGAFLVCFEEESKKWIFRTGLASRKTGVCSLEEPGLQGKAVHVYFGFSSPLKAFHSDSRYLGLVQVL